MNRHELADRIANVIAEKELLELTWSKPAFNFEKKFSTLVAQGQIPEKPWNFSYRLSSHALEITLHLDTYLIALQYKRDPLLDDKTVRSMTINGDDYDSLLHRINHAHTPGSSGPLDEEANQKETFALQKCTEIETYLRQDAPEFFTIAQRYFSGGYAPPSTKEPRSPLEILDEFS